MKSKCKVLPPPVVHNGKKYWAQVTIGKGGKEKFYYIRKERLHRVIWMEHFGPIPDGHEIHHIDDNSLNNDISNLACLPIAEHFRITIGGDEGVRRAGSLGGRVTGPCKSRGDSNHYRQLVAKRKDRQK